MKTRAFYTWSMLAAASLLAGVACSGPDASARVDPLGPDRAQFDEVSPMLSRNCGSLDCHGSRYRNFRVYGYGGTRLKAGLTPEFPKNQPEEIQATYDALLGLEPEIMRAVVQSGGAGVERLTVVRKARNAEDHKGGQRIKPGSDSDLCLVTWLASSAVNQVDVAACRRAGCVQADGTLQCPAPP